MWMNVKVVIRRFFICLFSLVLFCFLVAENFILAGLVPII